MVDLRVIRVGLEIEGKMNYYLSSSGFNITASGVKYASPTKNECTITITGLKQGTIEYLLKGSNPFERGSKPRLVTVHAGRVSTGLEHLFTGHCVKVDPSLPPDRELTISARTGAAAERSITSRSGAGVKLSELAQGIADDIGVDLTFQATDKKIPNYSYTGTPWGQVQRLAEVGNVRAFVDDTVMTVLDRDKPIKGEVRILNVDSGMIGIPTISDKKLTVDFLVDKGAVNVGGTLRVRSRSNPIADGDYLIEQLKYDIASHSDAFQYSATCRRL